MPGIQASTGLWHGEPTLPMSPLLCILGEEKWGRQGLSPAQAALGLSWLSGETISRMKSDIFCIKKKKKTILEATRVSGESKAKLEGRVSCLLPTDLNYRRAPGVFLT